MKKSYADIKAAAREHLLGSYGTVIGSSILLFAAVLLITIPFTRMLYTNPSAFQNVIYILALLLILSLSKLFQCGILYMHLKLHRHQSITFQDFFTGLKKRPNRIISAGLTLALISLVCQIPASILSSMMLIHTLNNQQILLHILIIFIVITAIGVILNIYLNLRFSLVLFLLIDYEDLECRQAFAASSQYMKRQKVRLFFLMLSFIGYWFLGILSLGIGFLWIIPYIRQTMAEFYEEVKAEV
ncbi:Predicted integral membrane protein [uncultured Roseburia sp.]|uniref:DUF975 family protein n=1 Tax=Brotonthovivens ammoniilytica TaxID=2981725 RepID=A0ABT2TLE8_9FIRM|nr:DUF975 family protein [Brotonthovivens ammoniilytica]MCU6762656.1 DUF975 family protein [Brotonthovivens ammoniilytica]SCI83697.1 Predicted integral membrane protein [uncultured Roseburia sp.]